jgi:hypothetical protein
MIISVYHKSGNLRDNKITKRHWMISFERNTRFVSRKDQIIKLEKLSIQQAKSTKIAICELRKIKKTQIALELAYHIRDRDINYSIFWILCTSYESVKQVYMTIAQIVEIPDVKLAEVKNRVKTYLSQKSAAKWLVIFDNADDMNMWIQNSNVTLALKNFLSQNKRGCTIFITRNRKLAVKIAFSNVILISELNEQTGVNILKKLLIQKDLLDDRDTTIAFFKHLIFLSLAITQAAAYVNENDIRLTDYVALLQEQKSDVVELLSENFENDERYTNIQNPVATT